MSGDTNEGAPSGAMTGLEPDTRDAYRRFGEREARGNSPFYDEVCGLIVDDDALIRLLETLPTAKRQPNLVFGAARYLGAPESSAADFVEWMRRHWSEIVDVASTRATQTNEAGRCATLLPFILEAAAGRPIALVEVGCSAGLALFPDLYSYRYDAPDGEHVIGDARPELSTQVADADPTSQLATFIGIPKQVPTMAWRGGLDLNPLDVLSDTEAARDNARWLEALVWPGQTARAQRLRDCVTTVRRHLHTHPDDQPHVVRGDAVADLDVVLSAVPDDLNLVVFHSAVLAYADDATRTAFEQRMIGLVSRRAGFTWISNEGPGVMPGVAARMPKGARVPTGRFVLAVDGQPRAVVGPHGQVLEPLVGEDTEAAPPP